MREAGAVALAWLYPLTFLIHIAEEYWAGERFFNWLSRVAGVHLSPQRFLALNALFLLVMTAASVVAVAARQPTIVVVLACIVIANAALHAGGTIVTASYSPGVLSAMVLWLPLAVITIRRARAELTPVKIAGAAIAAVAAHAAASLLALGLV
jgi:hypothetical protein